MSPSTSALIFFAGAAVLAAVIGVASVARDDWALAFFAAVGLVLALDTVRRAVRYRRDE